MWIITGDQFKIMHYVLLTNEPLGIDIVVRYGRKFRHNKQAHENQSYIVIIEIQSVNASMNFV